MDAIISLIMAMPILIILILALKIAITILIIRLICQYMAKQNAKAFDYDYLAERTAAEVCQRMMIIKKQKETAYKGATGNRRDQSQGDRDGAPEQAETLQE